MRKLLTIISILIMSCGLFLGCKNEPSISCTLDEIVVCQNETYILSSSTVKVKNYTDGYSLRIEDENIAKVVEGQIVPKSVGETKLIIALNGYEEVNCEVKFVVDDGYIAEWLTVDKNLVKINKELESRAINKVYFNSNCTEIPVVTYNSSLLDYDYLSGMITAKAIGIDTVTVQFKQQKISFMVEITNVVYTEAMSVNDATVYKNTSGTIPFSIFPKSANTYKFWTSSNNILLEDDGKYQALNLGEAIVYYQYYTAYNQLSTVYSAKVTVVDSHIDYEIDIVDGDLQGVSNYMLDKTYKLVISCDNTVSSNLFSVSNNIELKSNFNWVDGFGYVIVFQFKNEGDSKIDVYYTPSNNQLELQLIKSKTVKVFSDNDITAKVFWSAIQQEKINGKYRVFVNPEQPDLPDSLEFRLYLGDSYYYTDFEVFLVGDNDELSPIEKVFKPTIVGSYSIVVKMGEEVIEIIEIEAINV